MRLHLGLTGLALMLTASTLTACAAQTSNTAGQLLAPTSTATLPSATMDTSIVMVVDQPPTFTPTFTPTPSATPTRTPTAQPTATETPASLEPTAVLTPIPISPPAPDGVARIADVPILMYHYISAAPLANDRVRYGLSVPPEAFEAQLKLLDDNGFTTVTLRDVYEYLAVGTPLPENPIVLTFDDGYIDNYTDAFPLLQKYGMIGTFFVLTGPADEGDPTYLTWDMIQEMNNAGMDIQLHSRAHLDMRNRSYDWLVFQIIGGRQSIEGHTGKPVIFMAYPSGKYDVNLQRFLRDTNFWAAVTTASGRHHGLRDALNWDRVRIAGQLRLQDFAKLLGIHAPLQRSTSRPTATPMATTTAAIDSDDPPPPTRTPTQTYASTATPVRLTPGPGWTAVPFTTTPSRTPVSSPLLTPTSGPSPLMTPMP